MTYEENRLRIAEMFAKDTFKQYGGWDKFGDKSQKSMIADESDKAELTLQLMAAAVEKTLVMLNFQGDIQQHLQSRALVPQKQTNETF